MIAVLILTVIVAFSAYLFFFFKSRYSLFKEQGLRNLPIVPLFGNMMESTLSRKHMVYVYDDIYKAFPTERLVGFFEFHNPVYMLRDPELLKQVIVKDFDHFVDRRQFFSEETDPILTDSLFFLKGEKWRDMRSTLSPAFTGSKMRNMCPFMVECGHLVVDYLRKEAVKQSSDKAFEVEMMDLYTRFATDVIATTAFGCKTDSLSDRTNDFFVTGKEMTNFDSWQLIKSQITTLLPNIGTFLKLRVLNLRVTKFFKNVFTTTVKYRQEHNVVRPDMMNILMEVKKGSLKHESSMASDDAGFATAEESDIGKRQSKRVWTDDELIAQAFLFFFAGFDTVSTVLSYTSMELVANPEIQDKLRQEVDENYPENGDLTYELMQKLSYLDMVVSESMRVWAPTPFVDRVCTKNYTIPDKDGKKTNVTIEKGKDILIAIRQLHHDPLHWDEPEKFNPERFSAENKHRIKPFTYMPFGLGPRNCIGSRFALMEMKVILFYLIRNFNMTSCPRTMNPIILPKNTFSVILPDGFWIKLTPRDIK